jgi:nitroimidazol reductase NimA-like FMN-containing flavoprotein (pyridoxamine 5'-phosphate oxidase superfamily)
MQIHAMTRNASIELLTRTRLCRLACAHDGQPYVIPIYCAYHDNYLYSFSRLGQKIIWMRANPLVCVEVDELAGSNDWTTVIISGKYEELSDTPQHEEHRKRIYELLQRRPVWWEPGAVTTMPTEKTQPVEYIYFRIHINQISGHRGMPAEASSRERSARHAARVGWLRRMLGSSEPQKGDH